MRQVKPSQHYSYEADEDISRHPDSDPVAVFGRRDQLEQGFKFSDHMSHEERMKAGALRVYLWRRRRNKPFPTHDLRGVGVFSARDGAEPVREDGKRWCSWLGHDLTVEDNARIRAVFETWGPEESHLWFLAETRSQGYVSAWVLFCELEEQGERLLAGKVSKRSIRAALPGPLSGLFANRFRPRL